MKTIGEFTWGKIRRMNTQQKTKQNNNNKKGKTGRATGLGRKSRQWIGTVDRNEELNEFCFVVFGQAES